MVDRPDQAWAADITYIRVQSEFVYVAILLDLFTRSIRGWHISNQLTSTLPRTALERALSDHQSPQYHHSDQGLQYACYDYVDRLQEADVKVSMAAPGKPTENAFAERMIRTLKQEEVRLQEYESLQEAKHRIGHFLLDVYNSKRIHAALDYLTPSEFEAAYYNNELELQN